MFDFFKKVKSISPAEIGQELKKGAELIDVREPFEFKNGHINGAKNIPLNKLKTSSLAKNKKYLLICQSGMRSKKACKILNKANYNVVNISGGMLGWRGKIKK